MFVGTSPRAASPSRPVCDTGVSHGAPKLLINTFPPQSSSCWVFLAFGRCFKSDCQSRGLLRAEAACTMLSSGLPPVLLVLSVLELSWSLSDEEKKIILDEHNRYRSQVSPPAKAMMKMGYKSVSMEGFPKLPLKRRVSFTSGIVFDHFLQVPKCAVSPLMLFMRVMQLSLTPGTQTWRSVHAEKCIWGQNGGPGRENLFAMAPSLDVKFAVEEWNREKKFYNLITSTCVPGQKCDSYTQVVRAGTTHIGCGNSYCKKIEGIEKENTQLLVCSYYPP
ncbi:peptidase inhibitor 16-like [Cyanistes caeruleus]|uniref:peptidase inhibitor 16-like n=1 Tax=Cyanistes caeruleus TaxID=156563 RepID=UPI000CDA26B0|nr:peptidase inhibitor 16-like [Cyanistes caeruleus]